MSTHDDQRHDDDLDDAEQALAARLTTTLAGQAATVVLADEAFDPTRPARIDGSGAAEISGLDTEPGGGAATPAVVELVPHERGAAHSDEAPGAGGRPRRWIVWAAGAAAAMVLVVAIVAINSARQPAQYGDGSTLVVGPDQAWIPAWVPDGLELWDVQPERQDLTAERARAAGMDLPEVIQLIESLDGATRLLVSVGGASLYSRSGTGEPVTIRGAEGRTWAFGEIGSGLRADVELVWDEGGVPVSVVAVQPEAGGALAVLDRLALVDPANPAAGFSAPDDGSWRLRTEDRGASADARSTSVRFTYSTDRPVDAADELQVVTSGPSTGMSAFPGYLTTAFFGETGTDDVATIFTTGSDVAPASWTVWPDGRSVYSTGSVLDESTAERIAAEVRPQPLADVDRLAAEARERQGAGPVLARVELGSGALEVVGDDQPVAVCLTVPGGVRTCEDTSRFSGSRGNPAGTVPSAEDRSRSYGSVVVDGQWFVIGTSLGSVEITVDPPGSTSGTVASGPSEPTTTSPGGTGTGTIAVPPALPTESAEAGGWRVVLLAVPEGYDRVTVSFPGQSASFERPDP